MISDAEVLDLDALSDTGRAPRQELIDHIKTLIERVRRLQDVSDTYGLALKNALARNQELMDVATAAQTRCTELLAETRVQKTALDTIRATPVGEVVESAMAYARERWEKP